MCRRVGGARIYSDFPSRALPAFAWQRPHLVVPCRLPGQVHTRVANAIRLSTFSPPLALPVSTFSSSVVSSRRLDMGRSLDPAAFEALLQRPMLAAENAKPAAGRFPLIAFGEGLYYESPIAFAALGEFLAGRGFVVVTTPLVGTNSTVVRNDAQDLETQVRDLEFAIARARQLPFVSGDRLGVLGFDQGGMAGVLLAMRNPDVDAFASLDSGIVYPHPSGLPQASPSYDAAALLVPWLQATSVAAMG